MSRYNEFKEGLFKPPFISKLRQSLIDSLNIIKWKNGIKHIGVNFVDDINCYTDGSNIYLGKAFPFFHMKGKSAQEVIFIIQGVIFHEIGHLLYTSFTSMETAYKHIYNGRFWPSQPVTDSSTLDYIQTGEKEAARAFSAYKTLFNCVEDGRIENLMFKHQGNYGRFITGLKLMREIQRSETESFENLMKRYDDAKDEEKPKVKMQVMFDLILQISKFGFVKDATHEDYKTNPFLHKIMEIEDYIAEALDSISAEKIYLNLNEVYSLIFDDFLLPYFESIPDDMENETSDSQESGSPSGSKVSSAVEEALSKIKDSMGGSHRQSKKGGKEAEKNTAESRKERAEAEKKEAAEAKESAKEKAESKGEEEEKEKSNSSSKASASEDDGDCSKMTPTGSLHIEREETNSIWGGYGSATILTEEEMTTIAELDLAAINAIEMGEEESYDIDTTLQEPVGLDYGEYHKNLTWRVERVLNNNASSTRQKTAYDTFSKYVEAGKEAARIIKPFINPETEHPWEKNQFYGTRFKASRVANPNLRYFNKRTTITRTPSLSVAILIDESGSMYGNKIEIAKATAIALYEMCVELDVPYCVLGHSVRYSNEDVYIRNYCYFDEHEEDTKYRLLSIESHGCNRDGAALRYTAELLNKQDTDRKLLLIISDGQPAAHDYGGTAAEADIRDALREYERFGVSVIAAAIDADKEQIQHIYGAERFLRIDNIETLPDELLAIVKRALF